ncbi:MAG: glycogen synthase GlgA [Oscillospiraceae bacterium]|nr:glycogen synthase GlgA [Oscillospiraceae bacterium]
MKVLYAASEALPFIASGGLADVAGSLPQALRKRLVGCRVVLPLYSGIKQELRDTMKFVTSITVPVAWRRQYCGIFEARYDGVVYYLIDNEYYFKRDGLYGHYDDAERFAFFSRAVLEIIPHIGWKPDIIHCNDWQTGMTPVYYRTMYADSPDYSGIKTVFTIHNIQYQGIYGFDILQDVFGITAADGCLLDYRGNINIMKGAIECSSVVTTVSPTYAEEIRDPWFSHGLDPIINERAFKLTGILNGIDTKNYGPEEDPAIWEPYSADKPEGKAANKAELQEMFDLEIDPEKPVLGIVTRLVAHKGLDLVKTVFAEMMDTTDVQVVVLGTGDSEFENFFLWAADAYRGRVGVRLGFVPDYARKIYAGSDLFLMPSKSEPCGLAQMVALRYGSIPIVRETGGLRDTITDSGDGQGNGFTFKCYNAHDMLHAVRRAVSGYADKDGWRILVERAMNTDNSWSKSAGEYIKLYKGLL